MPLSDAAEPRLPRERRGVPSGFFGLVAAAISVCLLYVGRDLFVPFALAVLFSFLLDPLVTQLRRWHMPRGPAVALVLVCTVAVVGATSVFVASQAVELSRDLPTYQSTIQAKLRALRTAVTGRGVLDDASRMLEVLGNELNATRRALDHAPRQATAMRVQVEPTPPSPLQAVGDLVSPVLAPLATAGLVLVFVLFILLERNELRDRLLRLVGGDLHRMTDALNEAAQRVGRYLRMQLLINTAFALPMAVGLWVIGVPGALLWGLLAGALRFVPYLGTVIACAFPLTLAFAVDSGWQMLMWSVILIVTLELVIVYMVEPWVYGVSTGLAPVAVLVSAALWTLLWGPIGLILATPMTVCLVVMGRHLPSLAFLDVLFGRDPVFDAPTRLYQRLLAGDVEEAIELAEQQTREESLTAFYDNTAVPALRLAANDHARVASVEHRHRISGGMAAVIRELRVDQPGSAATAEPMVLCIGARWEVDQMAADMLAHSLSTAGIAAGHLPPSAVSAEHINALQLDGVQAICLSYFSSAPEIHARYVCRKLRRMRPDLRIVLGCWNAPAPLLSPDAAQALGADAVANSLVEAMLRVQSMVATQGQVGMLAAPVPENEEERLQALHQSGALEPAMQAPFDRAAQRVADIFDTPLAMVSLIDRSCQIWQGAVGVPSVSDAIDGARSTPRQTSLCGHVVAGNAPLLVPDVARDPRFAANPALLAAGVRFYAGAPLRTAAGFVIGALCIMDTRPRAITERELRLLQAMADDLMQTLATGRAATPPTVPVSDGEDDATDAAAIPLPVGTAPA